MQFFTAYVQFFLKKFSVAARLSAFSLFFLHHAKSCSSVGAGVESMICRSFQPLVFFIGVPGRIWSPGWSSRGIHHISFISRRMYCLPRKLIIHSILIILRSRRKNCLHWVLSNSTMSKVGVVAEKNRKRTANVILSICILLNNVCVLSKSDCGIAKVLQRYKKKRIRARRTRKNLRSAKF